MNSRDMLGDAPIHTIVRTKTKKRFDFLMALLVHGSPNVDLASDSTSGNAALHIAVEVYKRGLKFRMIASEKKSFGLLYTIPKERRCMQWL